MDVLNDIHLVEHLRQDDCRRSFVKIKSQEIWDKVLIYKCVWHNIIMFYFIAISIKIVQEYALVYFNK